MAISLILYTNNEENRICRDDLRPSDISSWMLSLLWALTSQLHLTLTFALEYDPQTGSGRCHLLSILLPFLLHPVFVSLPPDSTLSPLPQFALTCPESFLCLHHSSPILTPVSVYLSPDVNHSLVAVGLFPILHIPLARLGLLWRGTRREALVFLFSFSLPANL